MSESRGERRHTADAVLDRMSDAVVSFDREWRFTYANAAAEAPFGAPREQLVGRVLWEVLPELEGTGLAELLRAALRDQRPLHRDDYLPGFARWIAVHAYPSPDGTSVFLEDISARKSAESEQERLLGDLHAERALLDEVIEQLPVGVLIVEASTGRILNYNRAARRLWSEPLPADVAEHARLYRCFHPDGRPYAEPELPLVRALHAGESLSIDELLMVGETGESRSVAMSAGPVRNLSGEVVAVLVTVRDVTATKRREREEHFLDEVAQVLGASLDYRSTVQRLAELCARSIADCCVVHVEENRRIRGLGLAHIDPLKQEGVFALLRRIPIGMDARHPVVEVLRGGEARVHTTIAEESWRMLARSAEDRAALRETGLASMIVAPLRSRGRTLGTLTLARTADSAPYSAADLPLVHELVRRAALAVDNARLYREATRAVKVREQMLHVVSHDLRNSLNAALMNVDLLLEVSPVFDEDSAGRRQMEGLRRSLGLMHRLVHDLLDAESIESGRLSLHPERLSLAELARGVVETFGPVAQEREIALQVECEPGEVFGDPDRVMQILSNLISNALGFTPPGGTVTARLTGVARGVEFRVADTGPGIPEDELPRVFERYWRSPLHRSTGSGLGLAIVRGLVRAHGGDIRVHSQLGEGTTFTVTLPREPAHAPA